MGAWKDTIENNLTYSMTSMLHDCDPDRTDIFIEIRKNVERGFSFEDAVRAVIKKAESLLQERFSNEGIEHLVQQAIEDKEYLLR